MPSNALRPTVFTKFDTHMHPPVNPAAQVEGNRHGCPSTRSIKPMPPQLNFFAPVEGGQHGCIDCDFTPRQQCGCDYYSEFHPVKLNWYSAMPVCQANQGSLVTIPTLEVRNITRDRFCSTSKENQVWIGANDRRRGGLWEWESVSA